LNTFNSKLKNKEKFKKQWKMKTNVYA